MMLGAILVVLATLALTSCGGSDDDERGLIQPRVPDPNAISGTGTVRLQAVSIRTERQQYRFSRQTCRGLGPARIAYENDEPGTITDIARRWAERTSQRAAWRESTYRGCLAGFAAMPGAQPTR